ncbi:MAG: hypothetical protein JNL10_21040 [Verrucomicrobiales bacterium]|nr:hypothetical protein [Verrucomicrobiales bacterium]
MNELPNLLTHPWVCRVAVVLLHFLWQGALVAGVLAVALRATRRGSARVRYGLACVALLGMAGMPVATLFLTGASPAGAGPMTGRMPGTLVLLGDAPVVPGGVDGEGSWLPWITVAWLLGVVGLGFRLAGGWWRTSRLRVVDVRPVCGSWAARLAVLQERLGLSGTVEFLESGLVRVPMVLGWMRPVILVPVGFCTGLPAAQVEAILAHELAHLARHDYLVNLVQRAIETLLFYHPAVWWVSDRIRIEREFCCDDLAAQAIGDRAELAGALVALAERQTEATEFALAADGGSLTERVRRLLGVPGGGAPGAWAGRLRTAVFLLALVAGGVWLWPRVAAPRLFVATARVKVETQGTYDPYRIQTHLESLRSSSVLRPVAEQLRLGERWHLGDPVEVVAVLRNRVLTHQYRNSGILEIVAASEDSGEAAEIANAVVEQFRQGTLRQQRQGIDQGLDLMRMKVEECERKVAVLDDEYRKWAEESLKTGRPVNIKDNLRLDELTVYRELLKKLRTRVAETEIEMVRAIPASSIEVIDSAVPALRRQVWRN